MLVLSFESVYIVARMHILFRKYAVAVESAVMGEDVELIHFCDYSD